MITDEEDAEYRSFETLILTHEMFRSSIVMQCMFHAIWQPFNSLTPKSVPAGTKLILFGRYILNIYVGIV